MKVNITVKDVNDNKPELAVDEVFLCENDMPGTVNNNPYTCVSVHLDSRWSKLCVIADAIPERLRFLLKPGTTLDLGG